jgi:hypothetical protein
MWWRLIRRWRMGPSDVNLAQASDDLVELCKLLGELRMGFKMSS